MLGWGRPVLEAAAGWLHERFGGPEGLDLHGVTVVTGSARGGRRLIERLAVEQVPGRALHPPTVVTVGRLAERLCGAGDVPRVASELETLLARAAVLRGADPAAVEAVASQPPGREDWRGWLSLAERWAEADRVLWGAKRTWADAVADAPPAAPVARWAALDELGRAYRQRLAERGRVDPLDRWLACGAEARAAIGGGGGRG